MIGSFYDPNSETLIHRRGRPHWAQDQVVVFITFRAKDSIPREVITRWEHERREWLARVLVTSGTRKNRGTNDRFISDSMECLTSLESKLTDDQRQEYQDHFRGMYQKTLDDCRGACVLKRPEIARIVADSLLYFDQDRYELSDFVIMPNHVHLLAAFRSATWMERQLSSWLRYTATRINRCIQSTNHFWQQEAFDHLVRSPEQYDYFRHYIAENPAKAGLKSGEFFYYRRDEGQKFA